MFFLFLLQTGGLCFISAEHIISEDPKLYEVRFTVSTFAFISYLWHSQWARKNHECICIEWILANSLWKLLMRVFSFLNDLSLTGWLSRGFPIFLQQHTRCRCHVQGMYNLSTLVCYTCTDKYHAELKSGQKWCILSISNLCRNRIKIWRPVRHLVICV